MKQMRWSMRKEGNKSQKDVEEVVRPLPYALLSLYELSNPFASSNLFVPLNAMASPNSDACLTPETYNPFLLPGGQYPIIKGTVQVAGDIEIIENERSISGKKRRSSEKGEERRERRTT